MKVGLNTSKWPQFSPESLVRELAALLSPSSWTAPPLGPKWGLDLSPLVQSGTQREASSCHSASSGCKPPRTKVRCPAGPQCPSTPSCWCTATREVVMRGTRIRCQLSFTLSLTTSVLTACECTTVRYAPVILRYTPKINPEC